MTVPLLLLWDIDGTLLRKAYDAHREALHAALTKVYGIRDPSAHRYDAAGRTDGEIARAIALSAGVSAKRIDSGMRGVIEATGSEYAERVPHDLTGFVATGIPDTLAGLEDTGKVLHGLVTGNFEVVARLKLGAAGLGPYFNGCPGGFGSDSEDRADLPGIARRRAGQLDDATPWPRDRTLVIGDTPRDIACARADGVRVFAVAGGPHPVEALAAADGVAADAHGLEPLIETVY